MKNRANIEFIEANEATAEAHCTELGRNFAHEIQLLLNQFNTQMWNEFYAIESILIDNFNYDRYRVDSETLKKYFKSMTAYLETYIGGNNTTISLSELFKRLCKEGYIGLLENIQRNLTIYLSDKPKQLKRRRPNPNNSNNENNGPSSAKRSTVGRVLSFTKGGSKKHKKRKL